MSQSKSAVAERPPLVRRFPFVCVGMNVLWHSDGNPDYPGCGAIVTAVGEQGIDLAILEPDYDRIIRKTGVRWNHEPKITTAQREDSGGWDFTEADLRLRSFCDELGLWPEQVEGRKARGGRDAGKVADDAKAELERLKQEQADKTAKAALAAQQLAATKP